ncbi:hypothetical protein ASD88_19245 [Pelomonas sp. Root662]|nr:hypothetical protein ASC81_15085 [Pelomonas sp. Root405]KRA70246.1 hypothetical protein ASD88_19245 [Pelomonas sp. Root662]
MAALALSFTLDASAAEPVRGVWVAGPQHNQFWTSREAMRADLQTFKRAGLNTVYVVALMTGRTLYPSERMARITGERQFESLGSRDALQEVLDEAQPLGLRVVAWLELGFASHYGSGTAPSGLLKHRPDWLGLTRDGKPLVKNGFHWMNAFDPELQQLMIDLSTELLARYPRLHGVQGDDRLPASPSSGGYHDQVLKDYGWQPGQPLPGDRDPRWLQFRADRLTAFLKRWHAAVKAVRPSAVLSLSPSPYPWALDEYLQDWPAWMRAGLVDELLPQLYRRDAAGYEKLLADTRAHVPPDQTNRVFPGMLLALGPDVIPSAELLTQWIASTRAAGFAGEVQFHSVGVLKRANVFMAAYKKEARH